MAKIDCGLSHPSQQQRIGQLFNNSGGPATFFRVLYYIHSFFHLLRALSLSHLYYTPSLFPFLTQKNNNYNNGCPYVSLILSKAFFNLLEFRKCLKARKKVNGGDPPTSGQMTKKTSQSNVCTVSLSVGAQFENNNEIGVFAMLTNSYCLVAIGGSENFYRYQIPSTGIPCPPFFTAVPKP